MQLTHSDPCSTGPANHALSPVWLEGVSKRFYQGHVPIDALKSMDLRVSSGEFVAVMGASGSGKSTLLHLIAGLTKPDAGSVLIGGENLARMSDRRLTHFRRRRIGLVFQAFNLIPTLTAEENILLPTFADRAARPVQDRLEGLLTRLNLRHRRGHRPDALSGGEQQRVAIARALITDPAIVLADEPTGSVDSAAGQEIGRILRELCEEQARAIVVVTHEPSVAIWGQRVIVLRDGQKIGEFQTADLRDAQQLAACYHQIVHGRAPSEGQ